MLKLKSTKEVARVFAIVVVLLSIFSHGVLAAIPKTINYQGFLTETDGTPVNNAAVQMRFSLHDSLNGGAELWNETQTINVQNGIYNVVLGTAAPFPVSLDFSAQYYLEVAVFNTNAFEPLSPRQPLTSVPYALRAASADIAVSVSGSAIAGGSITPDKLASICSEGQALVMTANGWVCGKIISQVCSPGDFINCYSGPDGTMNVGICKSGIRRCNAAGTGFGECTGQTLPSAEICDDIDNDCSGVVDDVPGSPVWYPDNDNDGYGDQSAGVMKCTQPSGYIETGNDCNDSLASVHPGAGEICDNMDNDCDGKTDESCVYTACAAQELDVLNNCVTNCGSNFVCQQMCLSSATPACGNAFMSLYMCSIGEGCNMDPNCMMASCPNQWINIYGSMCDNGETKVCGSNIGACRQGAETCVNSVWDHICTGEIAPVAEICGDGIDNDCNGTTDDQWVCSDNDGDGFIGRDDCNDGDPAINPSAVEVCDGIDNNCDGQTDEGVTTQYFIDRDGDGYGDPYMSIDACSPPSFEYVPNSSDCDDSRSDIHPGTDEVCDGNDNNCNGQIDDNCYSCGNGICEADKGETLAKCAFDCPVCGDGTLQPSEQCEDGNTNNNDGCSSNCMNEYCGDGIVQLNEECDDGGTMNNDGCNYICMREYCGDGIQQPGIGEVCDDGNAVNGDGCNTLCQLDCINNSTMLCGSSNVGECRQGTQTCIDGIWSQCIGEIGPSAEICDGLDNDCDGKTDEDCVPSDGAACNDGDACTTGETYVSGVCQGGTPVNCDDGNECTSDSCDPASGCIHYNSAAGTACSGGVCDGSGSCVVLSCGDGVKNGNETDIDCGGFCPNKCVDGKMCSASPDCASGVCHYTGFCLAPTCMDMVKNGSETDIDCGGGVCSKCSIGEDCNSNSDCSSGICANNICGQ
ncbi:MAG: DUF4215 domain-containing protein [Nitrospirae bacterium]|nr:DUF4215 domain-containing protein [Nitrospirota bacterium]